MRARSEIGPNTGGNAIYPDGHIHRLHWPRRCAHVDRTDPNSLTGSEQPGRLGNPSSFGFGFVGGITDPRQILTLPGSGYFSFPDEWAACRHGRLFEL